MDKFGIFKLLNSFYDYYKQNNDSQKPEPTVTLDNDPVKENTPSPSITPTRPLQTSMLKTISSHDEIVKRVINKPKNSDK